MPLFPRELPELHKLIKQVNKSTFEGRLLAVDPGETTGVSIFQHDQNRTSLLYAAQIDSWPLQKGVPNLDQLFNWFPKHIVCEAYHVYSWKLEQHKFSEVPTIQIIGCLKTLAIQHYTPVSFQTAQVGKGFSTDRKLEVWDLYLQGLIHARDSIRHGCHYLLFNERDTVK